jgi:DNA-binding MarR family transcriptional regulator
MSRRTKASSAEAPQTFQLAPTISLPALLDKGDKGDGTFRQMLYDIAVAAGHLQEARQFLAERLGVTSPQYNIVMVIARAADSKSDGISVSDVAAHLNVSGAFVTTEVKKLVKAHLVVKRPNPEDARGVLLALSHEGIERVRALEPDLLMVNNRLFSTLSREDFHSLARIVGSLINIFGETVAVLKAIKPSANLTSNNS